MSPGRIVWLYTSLPLRLTSMSKLYMHVRTYIPITVPEWCETYSSLLRMFVTLCETVPVVGKTLSTYSLGQQLRASICTATGREVRLRL